MNEFKLVPSVGKLGDNAKDVGEIAKRRQSDLGKVTSMPMKALLPQAKACKNLDPMEKLKATLGGVIRRKAS